MGPPSLRRAQICGAIPEILCAVLRGLARTMSRASLPRSMAEKTQDQQRRAPPILTTDRFPKDKREEDPGEVGAADFVRAVVIHPGETASVASPVRHTVRPKAPKSIRQAPPGSVESGGPPFRHPLVRARLPQDRRSPAGRV